MLGSGLSPAPNVVQGPHPPPRGREITVAKDKCSKKIDNLSFSVLNVLMLLEGGCSSAGRAPEWHSGGRRFDPVQLHHP